MLSGIQGHQGQDAFELFQNSNTSPTKNIVIANKGDSCYMQNMDLDDDGIITLDEFNKYCDENSISQEEKMKLFQIIMSAKKAETTSNDKVNNEEVYIQDRIYAKKGEQKYNEQMDKNKDFKITYEEYLKYANENHKEETIAKEKISENPDIKKALEAYNQKETDEPEIKVDSRA